MKHQKLYISSKATLRDALKQMDDIGRKLLIVVQDEVYYNLLSIGDIQRAIINDVSLDVLISEILKFNTKKVGKPDDSMDFIRSEMLNLRAEFYPIVSTNFNIVDIVF